MKIAFFTNNYLPNIYGVPMSVETFRKEFEKLGHEVFIFAPNYFDYQDENPNDIPLSCCNSVSAAFCSITKGYAPLPFYRDARRFLIR
jgi:hypothetical protein